MAINGQIITIVECLDFKEARNVKNYWKNQKANDIEPVKYDEHELVTYRKYFTGLIDKVLYYDKCKSMPIYSCK